MIPVDQKLDLLAILLISHSQPIVQSDMTVAGGTSISAELDSVHVINYGVVRNSPAMCFIALITTVVDRVSSLYVLFILHSSFVIYKLLTLSILLLLDKSTSAIAAGCVTAVSQHSIRHRSHPLPL